ncbi:hypothetical protein QQS21_009885 [Conoideocrella luteorostrata]|uniref:Tail specific protease domain-containing protein n=1 Tax=Conoideocrella luteorostrata TaxID=1105319 RepID=A0AAJ0CIR2_9HYPO|nr:hypothetical protein QQS21_009885 [Conoideocrella luteorostrata]
MKLLPLLAATPLAAAAAFPRQTNNTCGQITQAWNQAVEANTTSNFAISGPTARKCLQSMPFDKDLAGRFLQELRKYIEFQSTLEALKSPPKTYLSSDVDILGGLDKIAKTDYASHYDFDTAINSLVNSANDGHFAVRLCSLSIFQFGRQPYGLASVSKDGLAVPELYTYHDSQLLGSKSASVSPITSINGQKAADFLATITKTLSNQDPDAQYNGLFVSKALQVGTGNPVSGNGAFPFNQGLWPGVDSTTLQFQNGSSKELKTLAYIPGDEFNITDGRELFQKACVPRPKKSTGGADSGPETPPPVKKPSPSPAAGYPKPNLRDPYNQINGYYLNNETAVLFIPSFDGEELPQNQSEVFANVATKFVNDAVSDGRTKLIIDVSGNGGGVITRAFDLFKLFFPDKLPYSATRFRRHAASESLAGIFGALNMSLAQQQGPLGYAGQVKPDQQGDFKSVDDFLGSETQLGVKVSSLFANYNYTSTALSGDTLRGYGNSTNLNQSAPFKPENIIIVSDGYCASTCTTFTNLMTNVGGVRTVAFGGRPKEEPMQIMGGVRGAQSASFGLIDTWTKQAVEVVANSPNGTFSQKLVETANSTVPPGLSSMPLILSGGGVNFRNAYQEGNSDLPLQFQYQAADCRLFYTAENYAKPHTTWEAAHAAIWGSKGCVKGSTGGQGSQGHNNTGGSGGNGGSGGGSGGSGSGPGAGTSAGSSVSITWSVMLACIGAAMML